MAADVGHAIGVVAGRERIDLVGHRAAQPFTVTARMPGEAVEEVQARGVVELLIEPLSLRAVRGNLTDAQVREVVQIAGSRQDKANCCKLGGSIMAELNELADAAQIALARAVGE